MADLDNDIARYRRGELTPSEMHALERQALNDPFLADALAGAFEVSAGDFSEDMLTLKGQLSKRIQKPLRRTSIFYWPLRAAAALLIIMLSTVVILELRDQKSSNERLADQRPAPGEQQQSIAFDSVTTAPRVSNTPEPATEIPPQSTVKAQKKAAPVEVAPELQSDTNDNFIAQKEEVEVYEDKAEIARDEVLFQSQTEQNEAQEPAPSAAPAELRNRTALREENKRYDKKLNTKIIRGKVTDASDQQGLPGVNVLVKGTNMGVITDVEGYYEIPVPADEATLVFSFIGLESEEVDAGDREVIDVEMDQDVSQLSEVVVVGYGVEGKGEPEPYTFEMAAPAGGRKAYKQYLEKNVRYPEQALENEIEGKVTVQFTVETDGSLTNFKVLKGLGYGCDEEIIRLIKEGPSWSPSKRTAEPVKDRVKVRLKFTLPRKK